MLKNLFFLIPLILYCFFAHTICFDLQSAISEEAKDNMIRLPLTYTTIILMMRFSWKHGQKFEGRDLAYLKIGYTSNEVKRAMLVDAGFHALNDSRLKPLLEEIDIFVVPAVNPDGYEYSRKVDREWRETRSGPYGPNKCFGVDPNRNFDYHWGTTGISHEPCDNGQYCGPKPFSEPETHGLANLLRDLGESLTAYITLHSYAVDVDDLKNLAEKANSAIVEAGGPHYKIGTAFETLGYVCSGASDDWSKNLGIKYVFTIELESLGTGFVVHPNLSTCSSPYDTALLVIADAINIDQERKLQALDSSLVETNFDESLSTRDFLDTIKEIVWKQRNLTEESLQKSNNSTSQDYEQSKQPIMLTPDVGNTFCEDEEICRFGALLQPGLLPYLSFLEASLLYYSSFSTEKDHRTV
uniref:Peptidase M14 carboxypeptidase A domain-containing protein n=1 Tax=Ditylenchus dipsaci TaxID=166011 RepID=A0A915E4G4_9BILA